MRHVFVSAALLFFMLLCSNVNAQLAPLAVPDESQRAEVRQTIGLTDITISYHRPAVKGREVWGKLVPFDRVWRAGANENTTISFSDPVKIAGKEVPAGIYGLHMIPTANDWTIIINKDYTAWGSFFYDQSRDLMRFTVKPEAASEHMEFLNYEFEPQAAKAKAILRWEKIKVPFEIEVDIDAVVLNSFRNELKGADGFGWQAWNQAAMYCAQRKINPDEAMAWVDRSININRNFSNLNTKARLLDNDGDKEDAEKLRTEGLTLATEAELNTYGYQLLLQEKNVDKAIEIFKINVEKFPDSWNVYDSLAEGYQNKGDNKLAVKYYQEALERVKDDNQKKRINDTLKTLAAN